MKKLILFVICIAAFGQTISNIHVRPTSGTAIVEFDISDPSLPCNIDLTYKYSGGAPDWTNVLPWANRALYPTQSVSGAGTIHRRKVMGASNVLAGTDGILQSMALPQATQHTVRIVCGSASTTKEFVTNPYPLGFTKHQKLIADPANPGGYLIPTNRLDIPNQETVNPLYHTIHKRYSGPGMYANDGPARIDNWNFAWADPMGSSAWTNAGNIIADDSSYAAYSGTSQDKLFLHSQPDMTEGAQPDWWWVRFKGCGDGADVQLDICWTKDKKTCFSNTRTVTIPNGVSADHLSCINNSNYAGSVPTNQPTGYDLWTPYPARQPNIYDFDSNIMTHDHMECTVTGASNTKPIRITVSGCTGSGYHFKMSVFDVTGNTAANGWWDITDVDANHFDLAGSDGTNSGVYAGGGGMSTYNYLAGFLVWPHSNTNQRVLLQYASYEEEKSVPVGHWYGGYSHTTSRVKRPDGKYNGMMPGSQPTYWVYDPVKFNMVYSGTPYMFGVNNQFSTGLGSETFSGVDPNTFYGIHIVDGSLYYYYLNADGITQASSWASLSYASILADVKGAVSAFRTAHSDKYGAYPDIGGNLTLEEVKSFGGFDYVMVSLRSGNQDSYWTVAAIKIDPTKNSTASPDAKVVALWITYASPAFRWGKAHSPYVSRDSRTFNLGLSYPKDADVGGNPMRWKTVNPQLQGDTTVQFVTTNCDGVNGPGTWYPCADVGSLTMSIMAPKVGDLCIGPASGDSSHEGLELIKITSLTYDPTTHVYTAGLQRNFNATVNVQPWPAGQVLTFAISPAKTTYPTKYYDIPLPHLMWDFLGDPYGERAVQAQYNSSSHDFGSQNVIGGGKGTFLITGPGTDASYDGATSQSNVYVNLESVRWNYAYNMCHGNGCESHPSRNQTDAKGANAEHSVDVQPWLGGAGYQGSMWAAVAGYTNIYKLSTMGAYEFVGNIKPEYKGNGFLIVSGQSLLQDKSGPGAVLSDTDTYKFCYAYRGGECMPGSAVGDVYVNVPNLQHLNCQGVEFTNGWDDLCAFNSGATLATAFALGYSRMGQGRAGMIGSADGGGGGGGFDWSRPVTDFYAKYRQLSASINARVDTSGTALISQYGSPQDLRGDGFMVKMPQHDIQDWRLRDQLDTFNVKINVPAALQSTANNAVVEFGYTPQLYCVGYQSGSAWIGRSETCVKGNQPIQWFSRNLADPSQNVYVGSDPGKNFDFAGDAVTGVPCATNCTVTIPVTPDSVFYYRWKIRDAANRVIFTSHACTSEQDCMVQVAR